MGIGNLPTVPQNLAEEARRRSTTLPASVQHQLGQKFEGLDLSDVKISVGHVATHAGAAAFADGNQIHFAPGKYDPYSEKGQQLIAHELAHVVQQRGGRVAQQLTNTIRGLEAEAARLGDGSV